MKDQWMHHYERHPKIIREVQETYGCCGYKYPMDHAWPKTRPDACVKSPDFGYQDACYWYLNEDVSWQQFWLGLTGLLLSIFELLMLYPLFLLMTQWPSPYQRERQLMEEHERLLHHVK